MSSAQFFRIAENLPAYKGAVRAKIERYYHEHEDEIKAMQNERKRIKATPLSLRAGVTREQLAAHPKAGAAPTLGQNAPLFDYAQVEADSNA